MLFASNTLRGLLSLVPATGFFLACSGNDPVRITKEQVTTKLGDTCGDWHISEPGERTRRLHVTCGDGMQCIDIIWVQVENELGDRYGRCFPPEATCDVSDVYHPVPCPDSRLTCYSGFGTSGSACFYRCTVPQDCPGPFQSCEAGACLVLTCSPEVLCLQRTHCDDGVCVAD